MLILFKSFVGILPLNHSLFMILFHVFVHAFGTLKIPEYRFSTRDYLKKVTYLSILQGLFLRLCNFHMNQTTQNSWPHWLSTYHWQFSTCNHFHVKWSTNPRVTSILPTAIISLCALAGWYQSRDYFQSFHLDFLCANLATPITHTACFQNFVALVIWSMLEFAVLLPSRLVSIVQSFLKASS